MAFPRNENISMKQGYHKSVFLNYYFSLKGEHDRLIKVTTWWKRKLQ